VPVEDWNCGGGHSSPRLRARRERQSGQLTSSPPSKSGTLRIHASGDCTPCADCRREPTVREIVCRETREPHPRRSRQAEQGGVVHYRRSKNPGRPRDLRGVVFDLSASTRSDARSTSRSVTSVTSVTSNVDPNEGATRVRTRLERHGFACAGVGLRRRRSACHPSSRAQPNGNQPGVGCADARRVHVLPSHGVRRLRRRKRVRRYLTSSRRRTEKGTAVVVAVVAYTPSDSFGSSPRASSLPTVPVTAALLPGSCMKTIPAAATIAVRH